MSTYSDYSNLKSYCGYFVDNGKLLRSSSGGAITAFSEAIVKNGGVVFGASYSDDFKKVEYKCVEHLDDLEKLKGSKYCETVKEITNNDGNTNNVFNAIHEKVKQNKVILFVGLGCDIGAVKAFCKVKKINTNSLYFAEILCHGPTTSKVHKMFINSLEKHYKSRITSFNVRYKKCGWVPPYIHAEFENNKIYEEPFYDSDYGFAFANYSRPSCYNCCFKGEHHPGDVVCGDFWGSSTKNDGYNKNGTSIIFIQTKRGHYLIDLIDKKDFYLKSADTELALKNNPMYYQQRNKSEHYEWFNSTLNKKGLHYAVVHYPVNFKKRVRRFLKRLLPKPILTYIKSKVSNR